MEIENIIMTLIVDSGSARSYSMEAIALAKEGKFIDAEEALKEASDSLLEAHHIQTELIQKEAGGDKTPLSLLMVHAQDHLMTSMVVKDMAREFLDLYKKIDDKI